MWRWALAAVAVAEIFGAQPGDPASPVNVTISGTVRDSMSSEPLARADVSLGSQKTISDERGRYTLKDMPPGTYVIDVAKDVGTPGQWLRGSRSITLYSGRDMTSVDVRVRVYGSVSGAVRDQDGEPVPRAQVYLFQKAYTERYSLYSTARQTLADDRGKYSFGRVPPGTPFLVLAQAPPRKLEAVSGAPEDPGLRKRVFVPAYHPNSPVPAGAQLVTLSSGEFREGVDMRLSQASSFCVSGVVGSGAPRPVAVRVSEQGLFPGINSVPHLPIALVPADGKIRLCDLHPGQYLLEALQPLSGNVAQSAGNEMAYPPYPDLYAAIPVTISDRDIEGIVLTPGAHPPVPVEVVWEGKPPERETEAQIQIGALPLWRGALMSVEMSASVKCVVPCDSAVKYRLLDDYRVVVRNVSAERERERGAEASDAYIKDLTYAGLSVLHGVVHLASGASDTKLRVVLAHDGGHIRASVTDKDGKPAPEANVFLIPAASTTEAEIAATVVSGETDQDGAFRSSALAPGRYLALASMTGTDLTPESVRKLWNARSQAKEVEVGPNATVEAKLELRPLE